MVCNRPQLSNVPVSAGLVVGVFKGRKTGKIEFQDLHRHPPPPTPVLPARSFGQAGPGYSSTFVTPAQHGAWVCSVLSECMAASSPEAVHVYVRSWVKYQPTYLILEDEAFGKKGLPSGSCALCPVLLHFVVTLPYS